MSLGAGITNCLIGEMNIHLTQGAVKWCGAPYCMARRHHFVELLMSILIFAANFSVSSSCFTMALIRSISLKRAAPCVGAITFHKRCK